MFCEWFNIGGVKVQGLGEKFVAEELNNNNIIWERPKFLTLPDGKRYTPDFDVGNFYIEAKGLRTLLKALGILSLIENGVEDWASKKEDSSFQKIKYAHQNIKPILIYVNEHKNDKKYFEWWDIINSILKENDIDMIYGKEAFIKEASLDFPILKRNW
jgi:hypothetical protein